MAKKKSSTPVSRSFLEKFDDLLQKNDFLFFWIIFFIALFVSIGLYDPQISQSGDDSGYILRANDFVKNFTFPGFQGPLYPIALAPIILIWGISLFPIKLFSMLSMLAFMYFTFISFRKRIPASILLPVLLLISINSHVLFYASQAYSEAFYMFMQALVIFVFFRYFIDDESKEKSTLQSLKGSLLLALTLLGACLTRSAGFALLIAILGYFLLYKQWKNIGFSLICFLVLFGAYSLLKALIWKDSMLHFSGQGSGLMLKDFYHPEYGQEDLKGFFVRFWQNSQQYLSNALLRIMNFDYNVGENSIFRTLVVYIIAIAGLCFSYKKNRYLFFIILTAGAFLIVTFFSLQTQWRQERLIIPVYAFILMSFFACFYFLLSIKKLRSLQILYLVPVLFLTGNSIKPTISAIKAAQEKTDEYSGLSPDWEHYMRASHWIGENLTEDELAACRKASISTIYANGKPFYGITSVPTGDADTFIDEWKKESEKYAAIAVDQKNLNFYMAFVKDYKARIHCNEDAFWVVNNSDLLAQTSAAYNISITNVEKIDSMIAKAPEKFVIFYADSLLNQLKRAEVTHILLANLRANPQMKTENTINTVERYATYIQEKYPALYQVVHTEGTEKDEPARVIKIRWELLEENETLQPTTPQQP